MLRELLGDRDNPDIHPAFVHAAWEFLDVIRRHADKVASDFLGIGVKRGDDLHAVGDDALVRQKRRAQVSGPDEEGFARFVPAHEAFQGLEELQGDKSRPRTAHQAAISEVFSHLRGVELQVVFKPRRTHHFAFGLRMDKALERLNVHRHAQQHRFWNISLHPGPSWL